MDAQDKQSFITHANSCNQALQEKIDKIKQQEPPAHLSGKELKAFLEKQKKEIADAIDECHNNIHRLKEVFLGQDPAIREGHQIVNHHLQRMSMDQKYQDLMKKVRII